MGKIAVIDSGIGGLTVMKEIMHRLPYEDIVYFGDQKNCPYGEKGAEAIRDYVYRIVDFLSGYELKALVIACNTATAVLLEDLASRSPFPVLGVIASGAEMAVEATKTKRIGVIGTKQTIQNGMYTSTISSLAPDATVDGVACPRLVPLLEADVVDEEAVHLALVEYLHGLPGDIDTLVLGCTHYPIAKEMIGGILGAGVALIDPAMRTSEILRNMLEESGQATGGVRTPKHVFYTSGSPEQFDKKAEKMLGIPVSSQKEDNIFTEENVVPSK